MRRSNPVIKGCFYLSCPWFRLFFFLPWRRLYKTKTVLVCFFLSASLEGWVSRTEAKVGRGRLADPARPSASLNWRNGHWAVITFTPRRWTPPGHHWEGRNGDYWTLLLLPCLPPEFVPVYFGPQRNSFSFVCLLGQRWLRAISLEKSWRKNPCGFHLDIRGLMCFAVIFYF